VISAEGMCGVDFSKGVVRCGLFQVRFLLVDLSDSFCNIDSPFIRLMRWPVVFEAAIVQTSRNLLCRLSLSNSWRQQRIGLVGNIRWTLADF